MFSAAFICMGNLLAAHGETILNFLTLFPQYNFFRILCHL